MRKVFQARLCRKGFRRFKDSFFDEMRLDVFLHPA
jgi:hypothetical protein